MMAFRTPYRLRHRLIYSDGSFAILSGAPHTARGRENPYSEIKREQGPGVYARRDGEAALPTGGRSLGRRETAGEGQAGMGQREAAWKTEDPARERGTWEAAPGAL